MEEVRDFYQDGQELLYDDDSDWEIAEEWERQYFYRRQVSPDMNKMKKIKEGI